MVDMLESTVRRLLKQAHLEREWWSYTCKLACHMIQEKVLGRPLQYPLLGQLVDTWKGHDTDQARSLDDRGAVGYLSAQHRHLAEWRNSHSARRHSGEGVST